VNTDATPHSSVYTIQLLDSPALRQPKSTLFSQSKHEPDVWHRRCSLEVSTPSPRPQQSPPGELQKEEEKDHLSAGSKPALKSVKAVMTYQKDQSGMDEQITYQKGQSGRELTIKTLASPGDFSRPQCGFYDHVRPVITQRKNHTVAGPQSREA